LATPNYGYEKRQRELAKKKKKEEKLRAKAAGKPHDDTEQAAETDSDGSSGPQDSNAAPTGDQPG
jgi:hypothetical protein